MPDEQDISGLEFTVSKNDNKEGGITLKEDEFYPAILTKFVPFKNQYGNQLRWDFEVQGPDFTWKSKDGKTGQFKVGMPTSLNCSPKSKLYKAYAKLTGKEPGEGEKISLKELIGTHVYLMVKVNKVKGKEGENDKTYYNVEKIKLRKVGEGVTTAKEEVKVSTPGPEIASDPVLVKPEKQEEVKKDGDIFEDIGI